MLQMHANDFAPAAFLSALLQIVFVNLLLSTDNALVIAMACRGLPRRQRIWGLLIGEAAAVILLVFFAIVISRLLQFPYLKIAGGLALIYIAAKFLAADNASDSRAEPAVQLWRAVRIIVAADIVMSFDNILAVAQIARGNLVLLAAGLIVSVPIIIGGAALIAALLDRLPVLVWAGTALLGWIAGQTIVDDAAIASLLQGAADGYFAGYIELIAGCAGAVLVVAVGGLWRHRRLLTVRRAGFRD